MELPAVDVLLRDPCVSYWLKSAITALLDRDPVDAANDAAILHAVMERHLDSVLGPRS
jgi:hypothetical protein